MNSSPDWPAPPKATDADPFRPSEYTGLLIHTLRTHASDYARRAGLDMGTGSGVLLGVMGSLGVERLWGIDIDPAAVHAARRLMQTLGMTDRAQVLVGSMWEPLKDERFDVVVANLPNFAATKPSDPDHSPYWSMGGADGRRWIDPFLAGLRPHLHDNGVAFMTHNVFAGIPQTEAVLARSGLTARVINTTTTMLHPMKSALLSDEIRAKSDGTALTRIGAYEFAEVQVLEIRPTRTA